MDKIEILKEELYKMALEDTINKLESMNMIKWPIEYGFDRAYIDLQKYYKNKSKNINALERLGNKEECYFMLIEKVKIKQY